MTLKKLSTEDIHEIKKLFRSVFSNQPWSEDWSDDEQLTAYIMDLAGCFNSVCYGYFDGDTLLGVSLGNKRHWYGGTEYVIEEFFVATKEQSKGIGTEFMQRIEQEIQKDGMTQIYLCTDRDKPAYRFYAKRGFTELTDHVSFFKQL